MDDKPLQLIDPNHPDAKEAAALTARLLLRIHEKRQEAEKDKQAQSDGKPEAGNDG